MRQVNVMELFAAGIKGTIPGAILGFVLAGGVAVANHLLFEKELVLTYKVDGKERQFNTATELNKLYKFNDDLKILQAFKHYNLRAFNRCVICTEKVCRIYDQYKRALTNKSDTTQLIASFQLSSMNTDLRCRQLFQSITDKGEAKEAEDAAMNMHLNFEEVLGKMRDELTATFNVARPQRSR